ncbi:uncharacterized protein LOC132054298 [Lycium ferocissimum]|uniref:uncharacterized protein LOC132054298 n=1 Tax=Lycium ferocissimum TaxID=112874 RepID=UPI002814EB6F|nr:uncharacterized protein LOC132054298 [Lycium ferocissimum]
MVGKPPKGIPQEQYYGNVQEEVRELVMNYIPLERRPVTPRQEPPEGEEPTEEKEQEKEEEEPQDMKEEELEPIDIEVEEEEEPFEMFPEFEEEENDVNDESDYYAPINEGSEFYAPSPVLVPAASSMVSENFGSGPTTHHL